MNKTELIKAIAKKANLTVVEAEEAVKALIEVISEELKEDDKNSNDVKERKVTLTGFGTFSVAHRKQKPGVNPKTGERIIIKAKDVPIFKPGKKLRESLI